jgi:hypothetical protein
VVSTPSATESGFCRRVSAAPLPGVGWHVALAAGQADAVRFCRNPLVVVGCAASAVLIWWDSRNTVPQWAVWNVQIGSCLLILAGTVLVAAHLAAGRARRDNTEQIYDSLPSSDRARTVALLLGLSGPLLLAVLLTAAAVAWLSILGAVGTLQSSILVQGVLLVALAGALGVALGSYLPHPGTGMLAVAVLGAIEADLLVQFGAPVSLASDIAALCPWNQPWVLGSLPEPVSVPPASHLAWLAAQAALAGIAALWRGTWRVRSPRLLAIMAAGTAVMVAVAAWSASSQTGTLPPNTQASVIDEIVSPGQVEQCTTQRDVHYCYYPGFQADVSRWATVVGGVLGGLPAAPAGSFTVRQVVNSDVATDPLFSVTGPQSGRLTSEMNGYLSSLADNPRLFSQSGASPVYVGLSWGTGASQGSYELGLALETAWRASGLPTTARPADSGSAPGLSRPQATSCLAVGQAREAIGLWLAASATPATRAAFPAALRYGPTTADVGSAHVLSYLSYPLAGYVPTVQFTAQGAALAEVMLRLSASRVKSVLGRQWGSWLKPQATDARLAAALGVALPPPPVPVEHRRPTSAELGPRKSSPAAPASQGSIVEPICQ